MDVVGGLEFNPGVPQVAKSRCHSREGIFQFMQRHEDLQRTRCRETRANSLVWFVWSEELIGLETLTLQVRRITCSVLLGNAQVTTAQGWRKSQLLT